MIAEPDATSDGDSGVRRLIGAGAEIAGGAVGGAIGFLAGGPVGAALLGAGGAAAAMVLKHIGEEASKRLLGPRETVRVGGVLALAAVEILQRTERGDLLRGDGFFENKAGGRSDAEEVAENILLKAQREAEEKKIPYMAHLLSGVAFDSTISPQMAHQIIKAAEQLTYRQLCLLKLAVSKGNLRQTGYRDQKSFPKELYQLLYECMDLYHRGFVNFGGAVALGLVDVVPGRMTVQALGADLYNLMRLHLVPDEDLAPIVVQLL